jgi:RimJ/RimL family protein N-acetyltransferase
LRPIDEELATRSEAGIDDFVQIWGGPTQFAERSFGVAVLSGDSLVAACTACAIGGHRGEVEAEIDVGTAPAHRQKGLAAVAAVAFFDLCRVRGVTPAWSCDSKNLASQRAAVHLGFSEFRKIIGFPMRLNALV